MRTNLDGNALFTAFEKFVNDQRNGTTSKAEFEKVEDKINRMEYDPIVVKHIKKLVAEKDMQRGVAELEDIAVVECRASFGCRSPNVGCRSNSNHD